MSSEHCNVQRCAWGGRLQAGMTTVVGLTLRYIIPLIRMVTYLSSRPQFNDLRYSSPPQSLSRTAACSAVMSRCGSASSSNPTRNLRTVADRRRGG